MMKLFLASGLAVMLSFAAFSQDTIYCRDGGFKVVNIELVDYTSVHYTDYPRTGDARKYRIGIENIKSIHYHDGRWIDYRESEKAPQRSCVTTQYKNPAAALLLSVLPGCGQFYNDQINRGLVFMGASVAEGVVLRLCLNNVTKIVTRSSYDSWTGQTHYYDEEVTNKGAVAGAVITGIAFAATYLWATIDAVSTANKLNITNGYVITASPTFSFYSAPVGESNLMAGISFNLSF